MTELTPLQVAALGVFIERPMHPYEAYSLLAARRTDLVVKLKPGTLYHAIGRLADAGQLTVLGTDRAGNRPERTTYEITETGRTAFREAVEDLVARPRYEYPGFPLGLSELHNVPAERAVELLRQRLAVLAEEHDAMTHALATCAERDIPRVYVIEAEYVAAQLDSEIVWLTTLVDRIASGSLPWHESHGDRTTERHPSSLRPLPDRSTR